MTKAKQIIPALLLFSFLRAAGQPSNAQVSPLVNEFIVNAPPFASCHASTVVELPGKQLMASWFAGQFESHPDVCIWIARKRGDAWEKPAVIATGAVNDSVHFSCWNPVLFRTRSGRLFLFYKVGKSPREWWGMKKYSDNDGDTWSVAEKLPEGMLGPIKNKPEQLADGSILYPSSTESAGTNQWLIHMEKSDSLGQNWRRIPIACDTFGVIQPSILRHGNGRLQLLCRSRQKYIVQSWSADNGDTWGPLTKTSLPNPNSGLDAVTLADGRHMLVYNPIQSGRNKLALASSTDGISWRDLYTFEDTKEGEYSYPAIIQSKDFLLHISYTYNRKNIKHVVLKKP